MPKQVPPDAESDDPFGTHLFGNARQIEDDWDDTDFEEEFFKALNKHVTDNFSSALEKIGQKLLSVKNTGKYAKYLVPANEPVYRFMSNVTIEKASSIFGMSVDQIMKAFDQAPDKIVEVNKSFPLSDNQNKVRSWTTNPYGSDMEYFVKPNMDMLNIVFRVDQPGDNFVLNSKELSDALLNGGTSDARYVGVNLQSEKEVISIGPVTVNKAAFYLCDDKFGMHSSRVHQYLADAITP